MTGTTHKGAAEELCKKIMLALPHYTQEFKRSNIRAPYETWLLQHVTKEKNDLGEACSEQTMKVYELLNMRGEKKQQNEKTWIKEDEKAVSATAPSPFGARVRDQDRESPR